MKTTPPSSDRRAFLEHLKTALGSTTPDAERRAAVAQRLAAPPNHMKPSRVEKTGEALITQFKSYLEGQSAIVHDVASNQDVPKTIAAYLRGQNAPSRLKLGKDPYFTHMPWSDEPTLQRNIGPAAPDDEVGLSHATAGISETGTLVLTSGPDNPVTLCFMPETHVVVIDAKTIVGSYEQAWSALRTKFAGTDLSRTVNFISGPSRTGDIGGRIVMGAHGPKKMCVIIVRN